MHSRISYFRYCLYLNSANRVPIYATISSRHRSARLSQALFPTRHLTYWSSGRRPSGFEGVEDLWPRGLGGTGKRAW